MKTLPLLHDSANNLVKAPSLKDKKVLLRLDLNVPIHEGKVGDTTRIERSLPTIEFLLQAGAKIAICSHLGRPKGRSNPEFSMRPLQAVLAQSLSRPVEFIEDLRAIHPNQAFANHQIILLENLRFDQGEEADDLDFAKALGKDFDLYVNDAFSCAHRAHASVHAITKLLPSYAGLNLEAEVDALTLALVAPKRPVMAVVGGAKISSKIAVLEHLIQRLDYLVIGGGMANTFLSAKGFEIGKSLVEVDMLPKAREIMAKAEKSGCEILLPVDAAVAKAFEKGQERREVSMQAIAKDDLILDIGKQSIAMLILKLEKCATLLWNGPLGVFELPPFDFGTTQLALAAAKLKQAGKLVSVAGGGDTVAALNHAFTSSQADDKANEDGLSGAEQGFTYVSTAGGAFLEWLEGRELPGITALKQQG